MNKSGKDSTTARSLRERAETAFEKKSRAEQTLSPEAQRQVLHELGVHQIQMEMQNEELRQAHEALEISRTRYFDLDNMAPVGYVTIGEQDLISEANLTAATLLGVERPALIGKPFFRFLFKDDQDIFFLLRKELLEAGPSPMCVLPRECDLRVVKTGGSPLWVRLTATSIWGENGMPSFHIVLNDTSARKQAEEKIVQLSQAVEQSPVLVVITNRAGEIEYVNPKFCAVTGFTKEEVLGRNPRILKSGEKSPEDYKEMWAALTAGNEWRGEFHNRKKSGELYWVSASLSPIRDASGHIVHYLAVKEDITERKRAEDELREKNAELERFTATVSHDLRSPLVTIKTFLGYLEEDIRTKNAESTEKDLAYIHGAAEKMGHLLDEVLELARIGHQKNRSVTVPLQMLVQEALALVAGQIAEREVQVEITQEPVWLTGDRPRLVAIFENLLDNAVKFLGDQPNPRIEIGIETAAEGIVLFVRDNGKGIDPRHRAKLFGLFEKLDPHTPGSGMGLAMVRRIVEMHGGKIWAQSDGLGCGSTFRFTLPKTQLLTK